MVTKLSEGKRPKCAQYWPAAGQTLAPAADISVALLSERGAPDKPDKSGERPPPAWWAVLLPALTAQVQARVYGHAPQQRWNKYYAQNYTSK